MRISFCRRFAVRYRRPGSAVVNCIFGFPDSWQHSKVILAIYDSVQYHHATELFNWSRMLRSYSVNLQKEPERNRDRPPKMLIFTRTSSMCHRYCLDRILSTCRFQISAANSSPNRCRKNRTVSWQMSMRRSCKRSSASRSESGNRINIMTARRMIFGFVLNNRKGLRLDIVQR